MRYEQQWFAKLLMGAIVAAGLSLAPDARAGDHYDQVLASDRIVVESTTPKESSGGDQDGGEGERRRRGPAAAAIHSAMGPVTPLMTWYDAWRELLRCLGVL
jgi:hypothetical protein